MVQKRMVRRRVQIQIDRLNENGIAIETENAIEKIVIKTIEQGEIAELDRKKVRNFSFVRTPTNIENFISLKKFG